MVLCKCNEYEHEVDNASEFTGFMAGKMLDNDYILLTTKESMPAAKINSALSPIEQAVKYRKLSGNKFFEIFGDRVVGEMKGFKYDLIIIRRYEYDAILEFDFTICPIPKDRYLEIPRDPKVFFEGSIEDAQIMLGLDLAIQRYYRNSGCEHTVSVSNTAPYDPTVSIKDGQLVKEKTTQSTLFHHTKVFGYPASKLELKEIAQKDREYVYRPLLNEFDKIVQYLAEKNGIGIYREENLPIGVSYNYQKGLIDLYLQFYDLMMDISRVSLGEVGKELDKDEVITLDTLREYQKKGIVDDSLRVTGELAVRNLDSFLSNSKQDIPLTEFAFSKDRELVVLVTDYLKAFKKYIKEKLEMCGEEVRLIYGPCFSNILRLDINGKPKFHFVDAAIVRKGGNTVLKIFPKEKTRALTDEEKERIIKSNNNLCRVLGDEYGSKFLHSDFKKERYFTKFDKVYI